jgi:molecular chaperone GrpE
MIKKRTSQKDTDVQGDDVVYDDEAFSPDLVKKLRKQLAQCNTERQEYLTGWQRAKADAVNRERETSVEVSRARGRGKEAIIIELLSVLDSFDMATGNKEVWESVDQNWRVGVEHIHTQLKKILEQEGVETIDTKGVVFNPQEHEPLEVRPTKMEAEDNMVLEVLQRGYKTKEYTLRPAKVIIGSYK